MASSKTPNAANLEALGAPHLAALLLEISADDPVAKRRLRLALAGGAGPIGAAHEIAKRLASIAKARSFIDWSRVKPLAIELEAQRRAVLDLVATSDPREAFELAWRLVSCAQSVFARSDDGSGRLASVFAQAVEDLGPLAQSAELDPLALATRAFEALREDSYGIWGRLVPILAPQLRASGLDRLRELTEAWQAEPVAIPPESERRVIGWGTGGKLYADQVETGHRLRTAKFGGEVEWNVTSRRGEIILLNADGLADNLGVIKCRFVGWPLLRFRTTVAGRQPAAGTRSHRGERAAVSDSSRRGRPISTTARSA